MTNQQISLGMGYAERIAQELACARAFAAKHDPQLQWDVNYHLQAARLTLDDLALALGCRVERIEPVRGAAA